MCSNFPYLDDNHGIIVNDATNDNKVDIITVTQNCVMILKPVQNSMQLVKYYHNYKRNRYYSSTNFGCTIIGSSNFVLPISMCLNIFQNHNRIIHKNTYK
jgi:hypothetical protein